MTRNNKRFIFSAAALITVGCMWAKSEQTLQVYQADIKVNEKAQTVDVNLDLNLKDYKIGRNGEMTYTPIILSADGKDSLVMDPFTICGRNRWYYYLRENVIGKTGYKIYRSGKDEVVKINETVPFEPWMNNSTVEVRQQCATCCSKPKTLPGDLEDGNLLVARINTVKPLVSTDDYVFAPPMSDAPVEKSVEGKAFVSFVVNKTDLNPNYMVNKREIQKILNSIDIVKKDPDAVITNVHIKGFASPEGSYENNVRLAQGRTQTLAQYVNNLYRFEPGIMTTSYEPEDWDGLRSYVQDSLNYDITNRQAILAIIDGPLGFDAKDNALKANFPKDYQVMLKQIYPWLRHSDYSVKYNIKVFNDINDLKRLYNSDPTKLRAVDFYTLAQQYPVGSPEYLATMKKAVEVYPADPMINLNVANLYLMEGDFDQAEKYLLNSGINPQANFARGVLLAKRGDYREAEKYFKVAKEAGISQADGYLMQLDKVLNPQNTVDVVIKTTKK